MRCFDNYTYTFGSRLDREWEIYRKLLFPTPREWQIIQNHHACDRLIAAGDDLRVPRAIEHRIYFETAANRDAFERELAAEGFRVQKKTAPTESDPLYGLRFYRVDTPHYYAIDALSIAIIGQGEKFGGQYDGWETSVVRV